MVRPSDHRVRVAIIAGVVTLAVFALVFVLGIVYVLRNDPDGTRMVLLITSGMAVVSSTILGLLNLLKTEEASHNLQNGKLTAALRDAIRLEREGERNNGQSPV